MHGKISSHLDLWVIRRNAEAHQPERHGELLVHVDDYSIMLAQDSGRGVEAGGARAYYREAEGSRRV